VEIQLPPSVQTGCLTYGPLDEHGEARVTLAYDHRVMDGALVADILHKLERTLTESLVSELITIRTQAACGKAA
jgi:pyruvate/2-oxoglutarate dehydrogenase complex dihydrolipoamide acyltransferase (E2) component